MRVYRCDFCNKESDTKNDVVAKYCYPNHTKPSKIAFYKRYTDDDNDIVSDIVFSYDVCPKCYEKIKIFLDDLREKNESNS